MAFAYGHDLLCTFDATEDDMDYLASLIDSRIPRAADLQQLLEESLLAGADDWQSLVDCARVIRDRQQPEPKSLEAQDVLTYVPVVLSALAPADCWTRTDHAISLTQAVAEKARSELQGALSREICVSSMPRRHTGQSKQKRPSHISHYWGSAAEEPHESPIEDLQDFTRTRPGVTKTVRFQDAREPEWQEASKTQPPSMLRPNLRLHDTSRAAVSPYFCDSLPASSQKSPRRPAPGVVSCVPFPPLDSPNFGLVQERLANDPFWLLIAVTFLIKTRGTVSIPVFEKVRGRFPTPAEIADPANEEAILDMIRPLGLAKNRLRFLQKYANGFLSAPPEPGRRYRVQGYDHRDTSPQRQGLKASPATDGGMPVQSPDCEDDADAWELGHLTKGKYALDSWRIFCRDKLLGRAKDWNGLGREGEFQPEWMRVRPADKELRAYLRWLWMREGWEWDPRSGEKTILREELRQAVGERRVEYDELGELRILQSPR